MNYSLVLAGRQHQGIMFGYVGGPISIAATMLVIDCGEIIVRKRI